MASDFNQVSESLETQFEIQGSEREFSGEEDASLPEMREICSRANLQMMAQDELMSGEPQRNEKRLTNESVPNSNCQIRVEESKKVLKSSENLQLRTIASECLGRDESVKERKGKTKPSKKPPDKLSKKVQFPKSPIRSEFPLGKENGKVWGHEEGMSENESIEFVGLKRENSRSFSWMKRRAKPDSLENESASEHGKLPHVAERTAEPIPLEIGSILEFGIRSRLHCARRRKSQVLWTPPLRSEPLGDERKAGTPFLIVWGC
uniref:Ig-like domain-containing protein n=1 Tax=Globodera pallida TaxID=36090 RepID=A0A183BN06_GLOPA